MFVPGKISTLHPGTWGGAHGAGSVPNLVQRSPALEMRGCFGFFKKRKWGEIGNEISDLFCPPENQVSSEPEFVMKLL